MTNSETDPELKISDGVKEEFLHPSSIKNHISKLADQALKRKPDDFKFESDTKDLDDISNKTKERIAHFFEHYKDLEQGKWVKLLGWGNKNEALAIINQSIKKNSK